MVRFLKVDCRDVCRLLMGCRVLLRELHSHYQGSELLLPRVLGLYSGLMTLALLFTRRRCRFRRLAKKRNVSRRIECKHLVGMAELFDQENMLALECEFTERAQSYTGVCSWNDNSFLTLQETIGDKQLGNTSLA